MNLPIEWLRQYIKTQASAEKIAEVLTLSGSEVEKIVDHSQGLKDIVVGEIKEIKPHPDADKLRIAYVDIGKKSTLEIVCGAPNIEVGQKVPTVLLGGEVPGLKIEARKIRGVASQGMLASERELGLGDDHSGILILPSDTKVGTNVLELLELNTPVLELDITPNRPDCFSVYGLAREVSAAMNVALTKPTYKVKESSKAASSVLKVTIEDEELCPMYAARVVENVHVGPSPLWMQNKLRSMGVRPINNVVDVTNYVMMELGQPMHAFDADKLQSKTDKAHIIVRGAQQDETIATLDEQTYTLAEEMCVIADEEKPIAIGGIMGGEATGVTEQTTRVILESATFLPIAIRLASRALGIRSDASSRHEKGVDRARLADAATYAASLLADIAGGTVLKGVVTAGQKLPKPQTITLEVADVERMLGIPVSATEIKKKLQLLGFEVKGTAKKYSVMVPSWRAWDVHEPIDLIEEIGRLLDYNTFPKTLPLAPVRSPQPDPMHALRKALLRYSIGAGYTEMLTYSFYPKQAIALSGVAEKDHVLLTNPVNKEYPYMRANVLPWMLEKLSQNSSLLSREQFRLFEIGRVFHKKKGEKWQAAVGLIDVTATQEELYRELRGFVESFLHTPVDVEYKDGMYLFSVLRKHIGTVYVYQKGTVPNMRFRSDVAVLVLELDTLLEVRTHEKETFTPLPFYPFVERDLGMIVPNVVTYTQIQDCIRGFDPLLKHAELFDVYHGLDEGTSLAVRLTFGSTDRTLESEEVDAIVEKLQEKLGAKLNITFR